MRQAAAFVQKYSKPPTTLGDPTPLKRPAPRGKTVIFLQCQLQQCTEDADGFRAASQAMGWRLKILTYDNTVSSTLIAALQQALQYHPLAVSFAGDAYTLWKSEVSAYKKAGVYLLPIDAGAWPLTATTPVDIGGSDSFTLWGKLLGEWFIDNSRGSGKALFLAFPSAPVLNEFGTATEKTVKSDCPKCSLTVLTASYQEVDNNSVVPELVAAVRRDPGVKYVLTANGAFIPGLPAALAAAGVTGVTIAGGPPSLENEQDLLRGTEAAFTAQSFRYGGWLVMDSLARLLEGMKLKPGDGGLPTQLLTKANVGKPTADYDYPAGYPKLFEAVWHR